MKKITITTEFTAEVPDAVSTVDIHGITMEMPRNQIRLFTHGDELNGVQVTGYTTIDAREDEQ